MKPCLIICCFLLQVKLSPAQNTSLAPTPPMGWMSWNFFADNINEKDLKEMADAMVSSGMAKAGYNYIFIDDGWQGGRDNKNNMIADPVKFPSGIKALAKYMHDRGLKLGIYSDAAQLTCAGYTASLGFEEQDAKTFAGWDIDYLKYDYCHAPIDVETAKTRYKKMADALRNSGRDIALGICEWGPRKPWLWAASVGGQLWRTTYDIRDKWKNLSSNENAEGILDILDINAELHQYSGIGKWNDADMLVAGLYGKKGPSGDLGGIGCTDLEYQSQFSLWAIMNSPLYATNDLRNMNEATKIILLNEEVIALNQDALGKQAIRKINDSIWNVFVKPLANGDVTVAILNRSDMLQKFEIIFSQLGLMDKYEIRDLWLHKNIGKGKKWNGNVLAHETKVFRLKKI
ncbi:MAG TPA: glycoside hydrolase family 27 protein [Ferruginibacter sp.]|nr:glycoside hydrolase family 27 protein [Ferruginibacter sp.]HMU24512.1 glycoside hydrolase family 27 protein [Ferruginibacter sp.]